MSSRTAALAFVAFFAALLFGMAAMGQSDGVIEGQVTSATAGDVAIEGAIVTLLAWEGEEELPSQEMTTDETGRYAFTDLERTGHEYQILVEHQGISYSFGRKIFSAEESVLSIPLTVYDTTSNEDVLVVDRAHVIIDVDQERLHVQEVHILTNTSLATYIARNPETGEGAIRFPLPTGAANLEWLGGFPVGAVALSESGFVIDAPLLPGTTEATFAYVLPFTASPYTVEKTFPYPVAHLDVFVPTTGIEASSAQLEHGEPIAMQTGHYDRLTGMDLAAGTVVPIELERTDASQVVPVASAARGPGTTTVIVIVVGIVLVVAVLGFPFLRRGSRRSDS